jgi:hypothetical protein
MLHKTRPTALQPGDRTTSRVVRNAERYEGRLGASWYRHLLQYELQFSYIFFITQRNRWNNIRTLKEDTTVPFHTLVRLSICKHLTIRRSAHCSGIRFSKHRISKQASNVTQQTAWERVLSLSQNTQNCSAAHPIGTKLLAEVKRPEHAPCRRLRMSGAIPQLPYMAARRRQGQLYLSLNLSRL